MLTIFILTYGALSHLHNSMADGSILPLPQHHQADDYNCSYGNSNHQQPNKGTAAEAKVITEGVVIILEGRKQSRLRKSNEGEALLNTNLNHGH